MVSAGNSQSRDGRSVQEKPLGMRSPSPGYLGSRPILLQSFLTHWDPPKGKTEVCWAQESGTNSRPFRLWLMAVLGRSQASPCKFCGLTGGWGSRLEEVRGCTDHRREQPLFFPLEQEGANESSACSFFLLNKMDWKTNWLK